MIRAPAPWTRSFLHRALCVLLLCVCAVHAQRDVDVPRVTLEFFSEGGCSECERIKREILPEIEAVYGGRYRLVERDLSKDDNVLRMFQLEDKLEITDDRRTYIFVNEAYAFRDVDGMLDALCSRLDALLQTQPSDSVEPAEAEKVQSPDRDALLEARLNRMTLLVVALGGLIDGVNPCAISTLVFFMSLLALSKVRGAGLLLMGAGFCAASFTVYLALGFGLLKSLQLLSGYESVRQSIEMVMVGVLVLLALLSLKDAWVFHRTGKASDVTLQLPRSVKLRIHRVMRRGVGMGSLFAGGALVGTLVTALESVCTGQVYVPTLVLLIDEGKAVGMSWLYLLAYNAMFVLPLVIVFILTYRGLKTQALLDWSKRNVVPSKLLLALFFASMAVLIIWM